LRDIHSFPTRRSSDLNSWPKGKPAKRRLLSLPWRCRVNEGLRASLPSSRKVILSLRRLWMVVSSSRICAEVSLSSREATSSKGRSEEHTSELQSRENL